MLHSQKKSYALGNIDLTDQPNVLFRNNYIICHVALMMIYHEQSTPVLYTDSVFISNLICIDLHVYVSELNLRQIPTSPVSDYRKVFAKLLFMLACL